MECIFCKFSENYFLQKNCKKKLSAMEKNKGVLFFRVAQSPSLKRLVSKCTSCVM